MFETVEIPVWALVLGGVLGAVALLDRLLIPSVRWYLRKRLNRAIEQLNTRLDLKIQPFKLTRRKVLVDRLLHDPKVAAAIAEHAATEGMPKEVAYDLADRYAREIVPSFSAFAYFGLAIRLAKWLSQALYRVRLGYADDAALGEIPANATVIFIMNHRSNMDYVLVTYLVSSRSALSYAVGEWARVWPLQTLLRAMGAYFIRRKSRNDLYRRVLARYVQMATEGGVAQAIFPEGGLSRTGALGDAKLGLLSYIAADFDPAGENDIYFVPIGLNYDRVLEDRVLIAAAGKDNHRFNFGIRSAMWFVGKQIWLRLTGRFHKFGYACVSFGTPISLRAWSMAHQGEDPVEALGADLMQRVGELVPVLPVSLLAHIVMRDGDRLWTRDELSAAFEQGLAKALTSCAHCHIPRADHVYAFEVGLRMLTERRCLIAASESYSLAPDKRQLVEFYANSIGHLALD